MEEILNENLEGKGESDLLGKILGAISVVTFIGGIIAILYFNDKNGPLSIFIFGAIFLYWE